jgi:hypothetical protein
MDEFSVSEIVNKEICTAVQKLMLIERLNIRVSPDLGPSILMRNAVNVAIVSKA